MSLYSAGGRVCRLSNLEAVKIAVGASSRNYNNEHQQTRKGVRWDPISEVFRVSFSQVLDRTEVRSGLCRPLCRK